MRRSSGPTGQPGRYVYGRSAAVTADSVPTNAGAAVVVAGVVVVGAVVLGATVVVDTPARVPDERFAAPVADDVPQPASAAGRDDGDGSQGSGARHDGIP